MVFQFFELSSERFSRAQTVVVLTMTMAAIEIADLLTPARIGFGPLYILPICFAIWRLTPCVAMLIAGVGAGLTVGTNFVILGDTLSLVSAAGELAVYFIGFASLVVIVSYICGGFERKLKIVRRDGMTGALIRSEFDDQVRALMAVAAANGRSLLLAYLDLDGFKSVNDCHGHEAGDRVLREFCAHVKATLRGDDCFGRIGGDEFAVLLPLISGENGRDLAEALHQRFTAALAMTGHDVTCSMGALVIRPEDNLTMEEVARRVDRLMYAVKRGGKNGFRFSTTGASMPERELPLFAAALEPSQPSVVPCEITLFDG